MVTAYDLKQIIMMGYLSDEMIAKLVPIVEKYEFKERDFVFRQDEGADRFYMLKRGKILLEQKISDQIRVSVGSVKAGYCFGWSAMLDEGTYTSDAVCAEPCEVFSVWGDKVKSFMENDHDMGYIMSQRLLRVMRNRLNQRTEQFIRAIKDHPDIRPLLKEYEIIE